MRSACKYLCLVALMVGSMVLQAQKKVAPQPNPADNLYTPPPNSPFDSRNSKNSSSPGSSSDYIGYAIKLMPAEMLRGNLVLENEFNMVEELNMSIGIGYNIAPNFVDRRVGFGYFYMGDSPQYNELSLKDLATKGMRSKGGIYLGIAFKDYGGGPPIIDRNGNENDVPFDDYYFMYRLSYFSYTYKLPTSIDGYDVTGSREVTIRNVLFNSGMGYSITTGSGKAKWVHDFYFGLGLKFSQFTTYSLNNTSNGNQAYSPSQPKVFVTFGGLMLGYSLGLGF